MRGFIHIRSVITHDPAFEHSARCNRQFFLKHISAHFTAIHQFDIHASNIADNAALNRDAVSDKVALYLGLAAKIYDKGANVAFDNAVDSEFAFRYHISGNDNAMTDEGFLWHDTGDIVLSGGFIGSVMVERGLDRFFLFGLRSRRL